MQSYYAIICRTGTCVPFQTFGFETVCEDIYEPDKDYVYVPENREFGSLFLLMKRLNTFNPMFMESLGECWEFAKPILCHYYLPPCGRGKQFQPPTAVCSEQCRAISQQCPEGWADLTEKLRVGTEVTGIDGYELIDCDYPGNNLAQLPHCCSELNINICECLV